MQAVSISVSVGQKNATSGSGLNMLGTLACVSGCQCKVLSMQAKQSDHLELSTAEHLLPVAFHAQPIPADCKAEGRRAQGA